MALPALKILGQLFLPLCLSAGVAREHSSSENVLINARTQLGVPLTTKTMICAGSSYKTLCGNYREPPKMAVWVVEGRISGNQKANALDWRCMLVSAERGSRCQVVRRPIHGVAPGSWGLVSPWTQFSNDFESWPRKDGGPKDHINVRILDSDSQTT